jgi:membrane protein YdbS with pleckstrin-like domain
VNRFSDTLRHIDQRLSLPEPAKSRVLLEIAADLEGLYEHFSGQGQDDEQAAALALEHAELSDAALKRLVEVHASSPGRFIERLSERTASGWERLLLGVVVLFLVIVVGREILTWQLFAGASVFIWPLAGVAVIGLILILWKAYELLVKPDLRRLRRGLRSLLALSVLSVLLGWFGFLLEMHSAALRVGTTALSLAHESVMCIARVAPMISFCLVVAVVLAVAWFVLGSWAGRIEQAKAARLLEAGGDS